MADICWVKLRADMFDDEKIKLIEAMPEGDAILLIWIRMVALAGKCDAGGLMVIEDEFPYTDEMLAVIFGKPIATIRLALATFEKFRMIEHTQKGIYITNFEEHQDSGIKDRIREQARLRKQREREQARRLQELDRPEDSQGEPCPFDGTQAGQEEATEGDASHGTASFGGVPHNSGKDAIHSPCSMSCDSDGDTLQFPYDSDKDVTQLSRDMSRNCHADVTKTKRKSERKREAEKEREKENIYNPSCASEPHGEEGLTKEEELRRDFEIIYALYPKKVGKTVAYSNYKLWVSKNGKDVGGKKYRLTNRQIYLAVKKYVSMQRQAGKDLEYWKNFDTLMGRQLLDYVDFGEGGESG